MNNNETPNTENNKCVEVKVRGIVNPNIVRLTVFVIITLSIIGSVTLSLLAIWGITTGDQLWRAIATMVIVSFGAGIFANINERFG